MKKLALPANKQRIFWILALILIALLVVTESREITRPFYGLHSWAHAHGAWLARNHVRYGLNYTKGMMTWAVGDPPPANPDRYIDHPQAPALFNAAAMLVFGVNVWALRVVGILTGIVTLLLFIRIVRGLTDIPTALLAGLIYVIFPLNCYFNLGSWFVMFVMTALWSYLTIIGAFKEPPKVRAYHYILLGVTLFLMLQFEWLGFFYAFVIFAHYAAGVLLKKRKLNLKLLLVLTVPPLISAVLVFLIMFAGFGWDIDKIVELYKWRSAKGEMAEFKWSAWFAKFGQFAQTNYTLMVLLMTLFYWTIGQMIVFRAGPQHSKSHGKKTAIPPTPKRRFPQIWLFLAPGVLFLLTFKGLVWRHQYWQRPFSPFIAISAAMVLMMIYDFIGKLNKKLAIAVVAIVVGVIGVFCYKGADYYYAVRWQPEKRIEMLEKLREKIPPDKGILVMEPIYVVNQHKSKGGHYRPEIAWHLDRKIEFARNPQELQEKFKTGEFLFYIVPYVQQLKPWIDELAKKFAYEVIQGQQGSRTEDGKFLTPGMYSQIIFDLRRPIGPVAQPHSQ